MPASTLVAGTTNPTEPNGRAAFGPLMAGRAVDPNVTGIATE